MTARIAIILAGLCLAVSTAAHAQAPEQLDQLEPGKGEWQAEYFGTFGKGGEREHSLEAMYGVGDRLALGLELEGGYADGDLAFESFAPKALYRFSKDGAPIGLGLQLQLGFDRRAALVEAEARIIAEARSGAWWAQGNLMLRRTSAGGDKPASLGYAWSLQRSLVPSAWLGLEGSGQSATLGSRRHIDHGHFLGPSLTWEWEPAPEHEVELGLAYLHRIGGGGPRSSGRVFVQLSF